MVDPSQYLVTDGHIYKRIDMPNAPSKQWRLEELNIEELTNYLATLYHITHQYPV